MYIQVVVLVLPLCGVSINRRWFCTRLVSDSGKSRYNTTIDLICFVGGPKGSVGVNEVTPCTCVFLCSTACLMETASRDRRETTCSVNLYSIYVHEDLGHLMLVVGFKRAFLESIRRVHQVYTARERRNNRLHNSSRKLDQHVVGLAGKRKQWYFPRRYARKRTVVALTSVPKLVGIIVRNHASRPLVYMYRWMHVCIIGSIL